MHLSLPGDQRQDWDYYQTFSSFRSVMKTEKESSEALMASLLRWSGVKGQLKARMQAAAPEDFLELLTEANDQILERINTNLDEAAGIRRQGDAQLMSVVADKPAVALSGSWNNAKDKDKRRSQEVKLVTAKNVARPQIGFKDLVDNTDKPFVPRIKDKPNSKKPLSILPEFDDDGREFYSHPYAYELDLLRHSERQLAREASPAEAVPVEAAGFTFVSTPHELRKMLQALKGEPVIGVDTEHHSYRTFLGLVSLIQGRGYGQWKKNMLLLLHESCSRWFLQETSLLSRAVQ